VRRALAILLVLLPLSLVDDADAKPRYGVVNQHHLEASDFERMQRGGVQSVRFLLAWSRVEPSQGEFRWSDVDSILAGAARQGIEPLPFVYGSPPWVARSENRPPLGSASDRGAYREFLAALVDRYGPDGDFWEAHDGPARPIRRWQLWNEQNFDLYWHPPQSPRRYARLLEIGAAAIRGRDPGAKIILGGVASVPDGMRWWEFLRRLYRVPGVKQDFDAVALHPYSARMGALERYVELARSVMREAGDRRTPLAITEIGWASQGDPEARLVVGPGGQARKLTKAFRLLAGHPRWRISDIDWYAWQDATAVEPFCSFCAYAGLFDANRRPKPSWAAFRRAVR
jgi:hypothetical protein